MNNGSEQTRELSNHHLNCSQKVFTAYKPDDMTEESALKLAAIFGGGMAGSGTGPCGAVIGALMAISAKLGSKPADELYEIGKKFLASFSGRMGSSTCEGILGVNINAVEKTQRRQLFEKKCFDAVKLASELLEGAISEGLVD